jgi:catechol 2,3-dioxygenase-like lactoylglutathione lyase family enzyme
MLANKKIVAFICTVKQEQARSFYRDVLGLTLVDEDGFAIVFDANGTMLRISIARELTPAQHTVLGWQVEDIVQSVKELAAAGVKFTRYAFLTQDEHGVWTAPGGVAKVAWFQDPDGNVLSLSQH